MFKKFDIHSQWINGLLNRTACPQSWLLLYVILPLNAIRATEKLLLKHSASQHQWQGEIFSTRTRAFNKVGQEPIRNFIGRSWPSPVDPMSRLTRESETSTRRHTDTSASSKNLKCSLGFTTLMVSSDIRYQIAPFCLCISWWRSHQNKWRILHIGEWLRSRILLE